MIGSIIHASFTIERQYPVPPSRVFAAWADIDEKAQWFGGPTDRWTLLERACDFRVGGEELLLGRFGDVTTRYLARYHRIVDDSALVYAYDMHVGGAHLSTSLSTVELVATSGGTTMRYHEQAAYFDGEDGTASRRGGTEAIFDGLASVLARV